MRPPCGTLISIVGEYMNSPLRHGTSLWFGVCACSIVMRE